MPAKIRPGDDEDYADDEEEEEEGGSGRGARQKRTE